MQFMESTKKIENLKNISYQELSELTKTIFKSLGYFDLKTENERCIVGDIKTGITTSKQGFILYLDAFTGSNADMNSFCDPINVNAEKYDFHTCYLVSTKNISSGFRRKVKLKYNLEFIDRDDLIKLID